MPRVCVDDARALSYVGHCTHTYRGISFTFFPINTHRQVSLTLHSAYRTPQMRARMTPCLLSLGNDLSFPAFKASLHTQTQPNTGFFVNEDAESALLPKQSFEGAWHASTPPNRKDDERYNQPFLVPFLT